MVQMTPMHGPRLKTLVINKAVSSRFKLATCRPETLITTGHVQPTVEEMHGQTHRKVLPRRHQPIQLPEMVRFKMRPEQVLN